MKKVIDFWYTCWPDFFIEFETKLQNIKDPKEIHVSPVYPTGEIIRVYRGNKIQFNSDRLINAYNKARQARFEYGGRGGRE